MKPRRKPTAARKPDRFPDENIVTGWTINQLLAHGDEFEQFHFINCEFSGAALNHLRFTDCLFERCNLASATVSGTGMQNVAFADCKLLGVQFSSCRDMLFGVHFDHCQLGYTSFAGKKMPGTRFAHCTLPEADFTNADLSESVFQSCQLPHATFHYTILKGADFTTATDFGLDPESNELSGARFALHGLPSLLSKYGIVVE
ncbi:pentapeptide repeat-containing protein [Hymenobacter sp. ASUV-10]|uniref:Pentapeptide repeat-containing protein n=1 Tax=Hymenobacter aranciens TaxID=3063996 RepID=A0ABT9B5Q6_9BACT|nr:pentapeptide repeat-containing protein [Hymenobacter sp. ASUV-10]MDO7873482.1 pentapeptide repeat-containing protein [Hymenobacter sp. ASUV-10]